jgi:hypothetical protein
MSTASKAAPAAAIAAPAAPAAAIAATAASAKSTTAAPAAKAATATIKYSTKHIICLQYFIFSFYILFLLHSCIIFSQYMNEKNGQCANFL